MTIPNVEECSALSSLKNGASCTETLTGKVRRMALSEYLEFLSPQPERPDPADPKKVLPPRPGAVCRSFYDAMRQKEALELACRKLGDACTLEIKETIENMNQALQNVHVVDVISRDLP